VARAHALYHLGRAELRLQAVNPTKGTSVRRVIGAAAGSDPLCGSYEARLSAKDNAAESRHFSGPNPAHLAPSVSRKASSDHTNGGWTISCPSPERPGLLPSLRMEVAMRRFSQQLLQWVFMFGLLALVLTCIVLAGCATMASGSSCGG